LTSTLKAKGSLGLPADKRLKTPTEFQTVYQSKQWGGSQHFTFNVLASERDQSGLSSNRLGVTVSKKVSKLAVDRNRIKRQIREFYRHHQAELLDADLIVTAKPSCIGASDQERLASLDELWIKILKWQRWHQRQTSKP